MNSSDDLKLRCENFLNTPEPSLSDFSSLIKEALVLNLVNTNKLQINKSTVLRWASGVAHPMPRFRKVIVKEILEEIKAKTTS